MLQRDYIQRLIREFFAALHRLVEKNEAGEKQEEMRRLFAQYLGDYDLYHIGTIDDVMQSFVKYPEEERLSRMEMLAELYYAEADWLNEPLHSEVLNRAFALYDFVDRHSRTYSPDRLKKMKDIGARRKEVSD